MRRFTVTTGTDVNRLARFLHFYVRVNHSKEASLSHQNRLAVTEELHMIKFVMEFEHAGLEFDIEVIKLDVTEHFFVLFAACEEDKALREELSQMLNQMFSCVGPGQHPACGCDLQH